MSAPTNTTKRLQSVFSALGDESRYKIIRLLGQTEQLCVSEVAAEVGISVAGVSQHMRVLERAGLVRPRRNGQKMCYQISADSPSINRIIKIIEEEK